MNDDAEFIEGRSIVSVGGKWKLATREQWDNYRTNYKAYLRDGVEWKEPWRQEETESFVNDFDEMKSLRAEIDALKEAKAKAGKHVGKLAGMLLFIIQGLRSGSIKSKPILNIDDEHSENVEMQTLERHIWDALKTCGITERKETKK